MSTLTTFALFAAPPMLACWAMEGRSLWWVLRFAISCWLGSAYGFLRGAWRIVERDTTCPVRRPT